MELENGFSFVYNLKPRLQTARFAPLADVDFFKSRRLVDKDYTINSINLN